MSETYHNEIMRAIGRIEGKQDAMGEDVKEMKEAMKLQNGRTRTLENFVEQEKGKQKMTGILWGGMTAIAIRLAEYLLIRK